MAFPTTLMTLAHAAAGNFLSAWFGGSVAHSTGDNLMIDDIIAIETKLGLGADVAAANEVLVGTGAGTTAFRKLLNADVDAAAAIAYSKLALTGTVVNADVGAAAAIAYSKLNLAASLLTADIATGGQIVKRQLNYVAATDIASGAAIATGGSWTDLGTNQSFTVDNANSTVEIDLRGYLQVGSAPSGGNVGIRLVIDSAGTPTNVLVGGAFQGTGQSVNGFGGTGAAWVTGLAAGSHTVKVQVTASAASTVMYCRPATTTFESLAITVLEHKR